MTKNLLGHIHYMLVGMKSIISSTVYLSSILHSFYMSFWLSVLLSLLITEKLVHTQYVIIIYGLVNRKTTYVEKSYENKMFYFLKYRIQFYNVCTCIIKECNCDP